jgi:predicted TIM-barrel fold metal-dependent hydrolase
VLGYWSLFRSVPNDDIAAFQREFPDLVIGFGAIDPIGSTVDPVAEIHRCVRDLDLKGIYLEPGLALRLGPSEQLREGVSLTDERLNPVYRTCTELDIPLIVLTGPYAGRDLGHTAPVLIDRVAHAYPRLKLVCGHGCWPYSAEILGVAYRRPNVFVSPDQYLLMPGAQGYLEGLRNSHLAQQFLFASNYPFQTFDDAVSAMDSLDIPEPNRKAAMSESACRLLGL